jgi:3-hydroxybutyrate dehydrogenase
LSCRNLVYNRVGSAKDLDGGLIAAFAKERIVGESSVAPGRATTNVDLTGRSALVTGAASGIGRACAERLSRAGAAVTVLDLNGDAAKKVADDIGGEPMQADLSDYGVLDNLKIEADVVVNNAGLQHVAAVEDFPPERFSMILKIMLEAPFRIVRAALPGMYEKGWGRVINISSVHGLRASPYKAAYVSAKHGLEGLSKVVALEGGAKGVTSNCICPAFVRTPLVENQIADQARNQGIPEDEVIEKVMLTQPAIKRLIEPEEVAEICAFLCAPEASFINGASLTMDGGWSAR